MSLKSRSSFSYKGESEKCVEVAMEGRARSELRIRARGRAARPFSCRACDGKSMVEDEEARRGPRADLRWEGGRGRPRHDTEFPKIHVLVEPSVGERALAEE